MPSGSRVIWLGLTPEPERELPAAVAALRRAADEPAGAGVAAGRGGDGGGIRQALASRPAPVEVVEVSPAYVAGEETAVVRSESLRDRSQLWHHPPVRAGRLPSPARGRGDQR